MHKRKKSGRAVDSVVDWMGPTMHVCFSRAALSRWSRLLGRSLHPRAWHRSLGTSEPGQIAPPCRTSSRTGISSHAGYHRYHRAVTTATTVPVTTVPVTTLTGISSHILGARSNRNGRTSSRSRGRTRVGNPIHARSIPIRNRCKYNIYGGRLQ